MEIEVRSDVYIEDPQVTIYQRREDDSQPNYDVDFKSQEQGLTEVKLSTDNLDEIVEAFERRFVGNDKCAVNFNYGTVSLWLSEVHAQRIHEKLQIAADIGVQQVIKP